MEYIYLVAIGIMVNIFGYFNFKGNINSIHWYNRARVTKENEKKYGKMMGIGMMIMGTGITITTLLQIIFDSESLWLITVISIIVGLLFMIYGQFKYNKGIF